MRNSFHLPFVQKESCLDQRLAVSGRAGVSDLGSPGKLLINFLDRPDGGGKGISVVIAVKRIQQGAVLTYQGCLGGGGACVDPQVAVALIGGKVSGLYIVLALAAVEFFVILLGGKEGVHTVYFKIHLDGSRETVSHAGDADTRGVRLYIQGRADGCE